jgi:hypothetical protein
MPGVKQASKRKRAAKSVPVLGAAGLTFSLVGGASAAVAPVTDVPQTPLVTPNHLTLGVEEIADVSLATFYVFDKESLSWLQRLSRLQRLRRRLRRRLLCVVGSLPLLLSQLALRLH